MPGRSVLSEGIQVGIREGDGIQKTMVPIPSVVLSAFSIFIFFLVTGSGYLCEHCTAACSLSANVVCHQYKAGTGAGGDGPHCSKRKKKQFPRWCHFSLTPFFFPCVRLLPPSSSSSALPNRRHYTQSIDPDKCLGFAPLHSQ